MLFFQLIDISLRFAKVVYFHKFLQPFIPRKSQILNKPMHHLQQFNSYDDFKSAFDKLATETFTVWTLVDSLYTDATKTQYKRATFKCVHHKKEEEIKSKGKCLRPNQKYNAKGCEAAIKVSQLFYVSMKIVKFS